jgi:hypothetical protein
LTRQRTQLIGEKARAANRIQKVLEDANIKLAAVATDVLGRSCRDMLRALIAGEQDPDKLAQRARRRLRGKIPLLRQALGGHAGEHHRFELRLLLEQVEDLEGLIGRPDQRVQELTRPFAQEIRRLDSIPGRCCGWSSWDSRSPWSPRRWLELRRQGQSRDRPAIRDIVGRGGGLRAVVPRSSTTPRGRAPSGVRAANPSRSLGLCFQGSRCIAQPWVAFRGCASTRPPAARCNGFAVKNGTPHSPFGKLSPRRS